MSRAEIYRHVDEDVARLLKVAHPSVARRFKCRARRDERERERETETETETETERQTDRQTEREREREREM